MQIRAESPKDVAAIAALTEAAFRSAEHSSGAEAQIVDALRAAGALSISLVAVEGEVVLGHVAFSPIAISNGVADWYGLGPVSVVPARQREGIGRTLISDGLERLGAAEAAGCVVLGDPAYYRRFGFAYDPELVLTGVPAGYFQRMVLAGSPPRGEVTYQPAFNIA